MLTLTVLFQQLFKSTELIDVNNRQYLFRTSPSSCVICQTNTQEMNKRNRESYDKHRVDHNALYFL